MRIQTLFPAVLLPSLFAGTACMMIPIPENPVTPETPLPESVSSPTRWYRDQDGDGFGLPTDLVDAKEQPPGYSAFTGDCDDRDALTHHMAPEACDGLDNDCDGLLDEEVSAHFFRDEDGDGFGQETSLPELLPCLPTAGYVAATGDCDDTDAAVHPGAVEVGEKDFACRGQVPDPSLPAVSFGLPQSPFSTLQAAVDAAQDGETLWIGPGRYPIHDLTLHGKNLVLRSTQGRGHTFLDGRHVGRVIDLWEGQGQSVELSGLTLQNGADHRLQDGNPKSFDPFVEDALGGAGLRANDLVLTLHDVHFHSNFGVEGAGLLLERVDVQLKEVLFTDNVAELNGGGVLLREGTAELDKVVLDHNAADLGAGLYLSDSEAEIRDGALTRNAALSGGGAYFDLSSVAMNRLEMNDNQALASGAGLVLNRAQATLEEVTLGHNRIQDESGGLYQGLDHMKGAGIYTVDSQLALKTVSLTDNRVYGARYEDASGAGIYAHSSDLLLSGVNVEHNALLGWYYSFSRDGDSTSTSRATSDVWGAGIYLEDSSIQAVDSRFFQNIASGEMGTGGAIAARSSSVSIAQSYFEGNLSNGWYVIEDGGEVVFVDYIDRVVASPAYGNGGAVAVLDDSSLVVDSSTFRANFTSAHFPYYNEPDWRSEPSDEESYFGGGGGAISVISSVAKLSHLTLQGNVGAGMGGALFVWESDVTLQDSLLEANEAAWGNAILSRSSDLTVRDSRLSHNLSGPRGAALWVDAGSVFLADSDLEANMASGLTLMNDAEGNLQRVRIHGNGLSGIRLLGGHLGAENTIVSENLAYGIETLDTFHQYYFFRGSYASLRFSTVAGNAYGGLLCQDLDVYKLDHSILHNNSFGNVLDYSPSGCNIRAEYTNIFKSWGYNAPESVLSEDTVSQVDPGFVSFVDDSQVGNDDFHLRAGSDLINAGDPDLCPTGKESTCDPDDTIPDLGAYAGPTSGWQGYPDLDADGLADSWEAQYDINTLGDDASADPDSDGLSNLEELEAGTDPTLADSDHDGESDGDEVSLGGNPTSPYVGSAGYNPLRVPEQFPSVAVALLSIPKWAEAMIQVGPGVWPTTAALYEQKVILQGAGEGQTFLDGGGKSPVLGATSSHLGVHGLTIQNGYGCTGGVSSLMGSLEISHVTFQANVGWCASGVLGAAGALSLISSQGELSHVIFDGNRSLNGAASAVGMDASTLSLRYGRFLHNRALSTQGGGTLAAVYGGVSLDHVVFADNGEAGKAAVAGIRLEHSDATFRNSVLAYLSGAPWQLDASDPSHRTSTLSLESSLVYQPQGLPAADPLVTGSFLVAEPGFLAYQTPEAVTCTPDGTFSCLPSDLHLALTSPLRDAGAADALDPDGSPVDVGLFGGEEGQEWDRDGDGLPDYFWPGLMSDVPPGVSSASFDCHDDDAALASCEPSPEPSPEP